MSETLTPAEAAVKAYLERQIEADAALREKYDASLVKKCFEYITEQARKQADGGASFKKPHRPVLRRRSRQGRLLAAGRRCQRGKGMDQAEKSRLTEEKLCTNCILFIKEA